MITVEYYYRHFRSSLDLFVDTRPYGIPLATTFVGNSFYTIGNHLKLDGYLITSSAHKITNKVQDNQMV